MCCVTNVNSLYPAEVERCKPCAGKDDPDVRYKTYEYRPAALIYKDQIKKSMPKKIF